jgi:hexosaminidase
MSIRKFNPVKTLLLFVIPLVLFSCKARPESDLAGISLIPLPLGVKGTGDYFVLKPTTVICYQGGYKEVENIARYLGERLKPATGFNFELVESQEAQNFSIYITLTGTEASTYEGYDLDITKDLLRLSARTPIGLFRGVQTIMQLLPPSIEEKTPQEGPWDIATGTINDRPEYEYRGVMLDVARHFFSVEDVKRLIDQMSYYKMNVLHLHLSDDQGWRIEIKSWPKLTETGGSTEVGGGEGGFYTQDQFADIVRFAADRYITIVPEIEMPSHTNAALASYPELNCNNKAPELYTETQVGFSSLCTKKDITYKFIDDVVREISEISPGPFFHIGGDEANSTQMEDYIPFINKVQDIVISHGKQMIGWDEIANAKLQPTSVAQFWANVKNIHMAVEQGAKVIMSPARKAYLDMKYDENTKLGLHWAAYIEVDSAYMWDPANYAPGITRENVLGIEAPLWTETITNMDEMESMIFPRLPGYAEIGWTPVNLRNWDDYRRRLADHGDRFKALGIDFYESGKVNWKKIAE